MAINKTVNKSTKTHGAMRNCMEYVLRESKINSSLAYVSGPFDAEEITYDTVYRSFLEEKKLWNKDFGRMYAHNIISWHKDEEITPEEAYEFGKEFLEQWFAEIQTLMAVHVDRNHIHLHMVTNTVSYIDGHKLHTTKNELEEIAKQYYLDLDDEVEAYPAPIGNEILSLAEQLKTVYKKQLDEIVEKSEKLGKKEEELELREQELNNKLREVSQKENSNCKIEKNLREREYLFLCNVLRSGHCKSDYVNNMGIDFWEEYLQNAIEAGKMIGKDEHTVKQEISIAMVSIYENLQQWENAYEFLIEQALGYSWLNLYTVQNIVRHVGYCERLKSAVYTRISRYDLSSEDQKEFEAIKDWLVFDYKKLI